MKKLRFSLLVICFLLTFKGNSQEVILLDKDLEQRIEQLFEEWQHPNTPGVAFAIVKDGKVIYRKNCGAADIENEKPITSQTRFNLAQLSMHFTSYGLLKLVVEGKLSLEDNAGKYIKELSNLPEVVSVKDLISHSSGLYDYQLLRSLCGWQDTDAFTQQDVLKLVSLQEKLAFTPGTDYAAANTNFALLATLIGNVSGKSFKAYMEEEVFAPIGMTNTIVVEDLNILIKDIARSYANRNEQTVLNNSGNTVLGMNNIYSCIDDLILWENHLSKSNETTKNINHLMDTPVALSNGRKNNTAYGELTLGQLYGHKERGLFSTYSTGSLGGHDSSIFKFPGQNYTAIALSNTGDGYNGYLGVIAAHNILAAHFTEPETVDFNTIKTKSLSLKKLQGFEGQYWDQLGELSREIKVKNDTLRYVRTNGFESPLIPLSENTFQMKVEFDDKIYIVFPEEGAATMEYQYYGAEPIIFEKYKPIKFTEEELANNFSGTYLNKEYNTVFEARPDKNSLILSNIKTGDISFIPIRQTLFSASGRVMRSIDFSTDEKGKINGFFVKNYAIRNLWFEKIK